MWRIVLLLLLLVAGCKPAEDSLDWHIQDRSRFMKENRRAVRIMRVEDEGACRKVEVEGLITKEKTWAQFNKHMNPKVGEIWRVSPITNGKVAWFELSLIQPTLED